MFKYCVKDMIIEHMAISEYQLYIHWLDHINLILYIRPCFPI